MEAIQDIRTENKNGGKKKRGNRIGDQSVTYCFNFWR